MNHFKAIRIFVIATVLATLPFKAHAADAPLNAGVVAPAFKLQNQDGKEQTLKSLSGPHGLLVLFSRSADWCGLCKSQMIDLESARQTFESKGIRVATITYDSPAVLKSFATRKDIHFELLSDPNSEIIKAYGVLNPEAKGYQAGIAIPHYFLIDTNGKISRRFAEGQAQERTTASYLYENLFGAGTAQPSNKVVVPQTPHLKVTLAQSDATVAPGYKFRLTVQLDPGREEHLYASGAEEFGYRPIRLILEPSDLYQTNAAEYGKPIILNFPKLKEKVPVFQASTKISQDVWALGNQKNNERFTQNPELTLHGTLDYQVCNKATCFAPEKKTVSWQIRVLPGNFDRVRVAEELQRK